MTVKNDSITAKDFKERVEQLAEADPALKALTPDLAVAKPLLEKGVPLDKIAEGLLSGYADRPTLGERAYDVAKDAEADEMVRAYKAEYAMTTSGELLQKAQAIAMAWRRHPDLRIERDSLVVQVGFTGIDFTILDLASIFSHTVSVPLQSQTPVADFEDIITRTTPAVLATTLSDIVALTELAIKHDSISTLLVFDFDKRVSQEQGQYAKAQEIITQSGAKIRLLSLQELIDAGSGFDWEPLPPHPKGLNRMALILHSSGSTGKPKGAVFEERSVINAFWTPATETIPTVTVGFAPLNHAMGRTSVQRALISGGTTCFTLRPDLSTLFEDIRLCRPTRITFYPRVMDLVYQYYQKEVARRLADGSGSQDEVEHQVKTEMRNTFLGDRLSAAAFGSAPTAQKVRDFMADCFQIFMAEGYSNTESGGGGMTRDNIIQRPPITEYRLRDVPELGYFTTDKPYPRGEFCFKTDYMITEYYKDAEATAKLIDEDGFSCTGDIVEERGPDRIHVIDRRKDVIKLAQAEYVAVGPLGSTFEQGSASIHQSYIYGNSLQSFLVAVIVPDMDAVRVALGDEPTDEQLKAHLRSELHAVAANEDLKSFEVPREFIIDHEPFSRENGLLTSSSKRMRPALQRKYGDQLEALYIEIAQRQEQDLAALKDPNCTLSTLEKLIKLIQANLGRTDINEASEGNLGELGGDSLGAVGLALLIEDTFGVELPADALLSPTGNLRAWASQIDAALSGSASALRSLSHVHGDGIETLNSEDLTLDKFLEADVLAAGAALPLKTDAPETVFLTGANGFLGHIVALQWMEKLAPKGGKLICMIRGNTDEDAHARLASVFKHKDPELERHFTQLAENHLEVIAGDLSQKFLGIEESRFLAIADRVDRVVHVGALVNHRLGYEHLFMPNVAGTAEIIRLAITGSRKPIDFVSTQAVVRFMKDGQGNEENAPLLKQINLLDQYAMGYAASKWAGEHLLKQAQEAFSIPVNVLRGPMMLAHRSYVGEINVSDTFTRLLFSIVTTGQAPYSFYKLDGAGEKQKAHYEGIAGDVVAAAVIAVAQLDHNQLVNFNVSNFNLDDGCSLDSFVDAIESYGYDIHRVSDFADWMSRFRERLKNLPDDQKQMSALNILGAFANPAEPVRKGRACENFKALMKHLSTGETLPHVDEAFIHKCLNDMCVLGMTPAPASTPQQKQLETN